MPVLLLSGNEDDHTVAQTQGADFVLKPFNVRELVTKVRSHIGR
jgi:DNA-binding response OmpR family regulator